MEIHSFPPIADANSRILILGTMPGQDSLRQQQYYAHPRNAFWPIMFKLFGQDYTDSYDFKQQLLLSRHIALWDTLQSCIRSSSLDSDIQLEKPNQLSNFLREHHSISRIFFNGQKAAQFFKKYAVDVQLPQTILPSTSPAHAINFSDKLSHWAIIKTYTD